MNVFQLINTVLEEIYEAVPGDEAKKDAKIQARLQELSDGFSKLITQNKITYTDPATRFAYIYKYVTSHSNLVYQCIRTNPELIKLFKSKTMNLSCIGGGPGSDLLGVLKYVSNLKAPPALRCHLLDGENAWADAWSDVDQKLQSPSTISTYFLPMNVCDPSNWKLHSKYLQADLFTMIYFLSKIYCKREQSQPYFDHLFASMKKDALVLYIDNNDSRFYEWFDEFAGKHNLEVLERDEQKMGMTTDEEKKDLGKFYKKFTPVKLEANVAHRICRKL